MVAEAGHEIGLHRYSHENPLAMSYEQESAVFDHSIALIEKLTGKRPTGYVAPWWAVSTNSVDILFKNGIAYDHSLMHEDFEPYYVRVGDKWTDIDYEQPGRDLDEAVHARQADDARSRYRPPGISTTCRR